MKLTAYSLIILPLILILVRYTNNEKSERGLYPDHRFSVTYKFFISGEDKRFRVKSFLPVSSNRQQIFDPSADVQGGGPDVIFQGNNKRLIWTGHVDGDTAITYSFSHKGKKAVYSIDPELGLPEEIPGELQPFTMPSSLIQSNSKRIKNLSAGLTNTEGTLKEVVETLFDYVYRMPSNSTNALTDALTALDKFEASCNGKSRLFVAMLRSKNIPARMVGGIILKETRKKTSHAWVEANIGGQWIPFDPLNGHFATIPSHYMEIYKGDEFLITRTKGIEFDYVYEIKKERINDFGHYALINLWQILDSTGIPFKPLRLLLLLPIGAFVVALFKNVVGVKTYGIFLPVLIGLTFVETGFWTGLILFSSVIAVIGIINYPLERWGILHTPKVVVMLIAVVMYCLLSIQFMYSANWADPAAALFFPIIILTIAAEKFARKVEEDSFVEALKLYGQTLIVTVACFLVLSSVSIQNFVITFPEILLTIGGITVLLGKWIGLRLTEYNRFYQLSNEVAYVS